MRFSITRYTNWFHWLLGGVLTLLLIDVALMLLFDCSLFMASYWDQFGWSPSLSWWYYVAQRSILALCLVAMLAVLQSPALACEAKRLLRVALAVKINDSETPSVSLRIMAAAFVWCGVLPLLSLLKWGLWDPYWFQLPTYCGALLIRAAFAVIAVGLAMGLARCNVVAWWLAVSGALVTVGISLIALPTNLYRGLTAHGTVQPLRIPAGLGYLVTAASLVPVVVIAAGLADFLYRRRFRLYQINHNVLLPCAFTII